MRTLAQAARPIVASLLVLPCLLVSTPCQAQSTDDMAICARVTTPPVPYQASIAACARVINSGNWSSRTVAIAFHNRCAAHAALGESRRAIEDCDEAIRLSPDYASAYVNRGAAYVALGENQRAIDDYDRAIRLDPSNSTAYNGRCYSLAVMGRAAQALADCERSLRLQPNVADALDSRGYVYLRLERWAEARRDYDAAIEGNTGHALAWFGRAVVRARQGDEAGARADLATARRLRSDIDTHAARLGLTAPSFGAPQQR